MIDLFFQHYYAFCQLGVLGFICFVCHTMDADERSKEFNREKFIAACAAVIFAPLTVVGILAAWVISENQERKRTERRKIMREWERKAQMEEELFKVGTWNWYETEHEDRKHEALRESVKHLTDKDLKLLASGDSHWRTSKTDKIMLDTVMDEIVHREIAKA